MALSIGKRDVAAMAKVLDGEYEDVEEAATAAIEAAFDMYERKAKFTVVGQIHFDPNRGFIGPHEKFAGRIALGRYGSESQANAAARSLVSSSALAETWRAWVLPVFHGTPAAFYKERKAIQERLNAGATQTERAIHIRSWLEHHPGLDRKEYPGIPKYDPRSDCPICGSEVEEQDD